MKKWHYFLVALFAVFCSSAIVIGSSVNSYVGAKRYAGAYMSYDVNVDDDSPYWEQVSNSDLADFYQNTFGYGGYAYHFYIDVVVNDDDPEYVYNEYYLKVKAFDGTNVSVHDSNGDDWYADDSNVSNFLDSNNVFIDNGVIWVSSGSDVIYMSFNPSTYYFTTDDSIVGYYFSYGENIIKLSYGYLYLNDVLIDFDGLVNTDDAYQCSFIVGDDFYFYTLALADDSSVLVVVHSDGTYSIIPQDIPDIIVESPYNEMNLYSWSDGKYAYYDNGSTHMIFDTATNEWVSHTWIGYTGSFSRSNVWSDGNDIYMTLSNGQTYKLHVENAYVSPYPNVLSELIALMTGGIAGFASGIGENLSVLAESIFVDATYGGLSAFGGLVVIFSAVALSLGLSRWVVNFITSFGRRDR